MFTFLLYNHVVKKVEVEYATQYYHDMYEFYWLYLNKEVKNTIKSLEQLEAKIDWWENEFVLTHRKISPHLVISQNENGEFGIIRDHHVKQQLFEYAVKVGKECPIMRLIHTNTDSATAPPTKSLSIMYDKRADYWPVVSKPIFHLRQEQNQNAQAV
jgi:hypothetical protein